MTNQFLLFDGDDTLWNTQPIYAQALEEFYKVLTCIGFGPRERLEQEFTNDNVEYVTAYGFGSRHLGDLMATFYVRECLYIYHTEINKQIRELLREIGNLVYEAVPEVMPMARAVLRMLARDNILILYTAGNVEVQWAKIDDTSMRELFDDVWITSRKDGTDLLRRLESAHIPLDGTIMVGNSIKSDVLPALEAGIKAIHFDNATWAYEDKVPETPEGVIRINTLLDVTHAVDHLRSLYGVAA